MFTKLAAYAILAGLQDEAATLSKQLATDQTAMQALQDEFDDDEDEISEYNANPFGFMIQSGVDIVSVMTEAAQLVASVKNAQDSIDTLDQMSTPVQQLGSANGAVNTLSGLVSELTTNMINLQTAADQIVKK